MAQYTSAINNDKMHTYLVGVGRGWGGGAGFEECGWPILLASTVLIRGWLLFEGGAHFILFCNVAQAV